MTDKKVMKIFTDSALIVGIASGIGYIAKKSMKESLMNDPSSSLANYAKWVLVLSGSMLTKGFAEDKGWIPKPT